MAVLFVVLLAITFARAARAARVVADVNAATASCGVALDGAAKVFITSTSITVPPTCDYTLAPTLAAGPHTITMTALSVNDPVYGTQESAPSSAFPFTKPGAPGVPTNFRLLP